MAGNNNRGIGGAGGLAVHSETVVTVVGVFNAGGDGGRGGDAPAVTSEMQMTVTVTLDKMNATIELSEINPADYFNQNL